MEKDRFNELFVDELKVSMRNRSPDRLMYILDNIHDKDPSTLRHCLQAMSDDIIVDDHTISHGNWAVEYYQDGDYIYMDDGENKRMFPNLDRALYHLDYELYKLMCKKN